ncbi:MAG: sterol carrier family protein, partial [Micrococcales bacterium]|nr:sterol carrier family protein [Micrococcales bacterium]
MPPRRRIDPEQGRLAYECWQQEQALDRAALATAVRYTLEELGLRVPGRSVEVRVPPFGAVQCIAGPRHPRGTPPNVVETDADTWLGLTSGRLTWAQAEASGRVRASGRRADLAAYLPLDALPGQTLPGQGLPVQ